DATTTDAADAAPPDAANATAPATAADATAAATATPATAADTADTADADDIDDGYCVTKTIDISEGGFKSIVETPLAKNTKISCLVEVDNLSRSKGTLIGSVIRCDPMVDSLAMYELTVQFTEMDSSVKEYLVRSIEKKHPGAVDAKAKIVISDDGLEASIELAPPRNNGSDLSFEALNVALASEGVTFGIDSDALRELSEKPLYNLEKTVAHGVAPINGEDAIITYNVDMNPTLMPKEHADGSVDFKDIGLINQVSKDDVLATKIPLTEGTPGRGVTGSIFAPVPGKDKKLPLGANTVVNDLDTDLLAGIDGCISIVDNKINVFDTYVVEGDVQYETGNISHNGIVIIKGDVRYGFAVDATGDIVIHGTVESATVTAGGSLVVKGGCVGEENAIETGGNAAVKFIDGGSFNVRGSLSTTYIINSTIKCGGSIDMIGNGVIRNSHVVAHAEINAKSIGSVRAAADKTVVEVGNDPELLNRFIAATKKLEQLVKDMDSFETTIRALTIRKYKNELSAEKLKVLDKSKILVKQFTLQHDELSEECTMLKDEINKLGYGTIKVQNTAYEGLRIIIGSSTLVLKDSIKAVKFTRNDEGISSAPLY
ncbi:MAG: FapA family protein, partial [Oscillospiraceae bacterium]|nr:FapA family protein [Oscillospiraceae bacterium]